MPKTETVRDFGRPPEQGRIRIGVKTGNAMRSIDTFRFTSTDKEALEAIAKVYGGKVVVWNDPRATPKNQHQVITGSNVLNVILPDDALSQWFETWGGGGCTRRCDGEVMQIPVEGAPCQCRVQGRRTCKPYTRLRVLLPDIPFGGTWRLETKGWNAAEELASMEAFLSGLAQRGTMLQAELYLEQRSIVKENKTKNFVVPGLRLRHSIAQIMQGGGTVRELGHVPMPELAAGDDEVVDAELVEEDLSQAGHRLVATHGDELTDKIYDRAARILVAHPGFGRDDDDVVGNLVHHMSKGKKSDVADLTAANKTQLIRFMDAVLDGSKPLPST